MNVLKSYEFKKRLKERFDLDYEDINLSKMEIYSKKNLMYCPYKSINIKLPKKPDNMFYLVDESKNLLIAGCKNENSVSLNTAMYLSGSAEGYY